MSLMNIELAEKCLGQILSFDQTLYILCGLEQNGAKNPRSELVTVCRTDVNAGWKILHADSVTYRIQMSIATIYIQTSPKTIDLR